MAPDDDRTHSEDAPDGGLVGMTAYDSDGEKIGTVGQVYVNDSSGNPEWVTVRTGLFGKKESFVPLSGCRRATSGDLHLRYDKDTVREAPRLDAEEHLDAADERRLYEHYNITRGAGENIPDTRPDRTTAGDAAGMVRSEEQLRVGTEQHETGRARLRKFVVTEDVTTTVPVSHEEAHVVREPLQGDARTGNRPPIEDAEAEVTLHAEQPVVRKEAVPVERVRLETDKVTEQQDVSEKIRKERVEYDTDHNPDDRGGKHGPRH